MYRNDVELFKNFLFSLFSIRAQKEIIFVFITFVFIFNRGKR